MSLKTEYNTMVIRIEKVLKELFLLFPTCKFLYIKILPRPWWGRHARLLAKWLDYLILCKWRKRYRIAEIWPRELYTTKHYVQNELVHFGMLGSDVVHLNDYGNRGLVSSIMRPLLHMWADLVKP